MHRLLLDAVDGARCGDPRDLEDRGCHIDHVGELRAQPSCIGDPIGPMHDQGITGTAEVRADLLAPPERRIPGPGPGSPVVRRHDRRAPLFDPAVALRELELHLVGERDAVLHRQLVERTGDGSLHARAVVAPDPDDQGVIELPELLDRIDHPPDVVVGVLGIPGVDLHLAGIERLQPVGHVVPCRECLVAGGQLGVGGDDAELLLTSEGLVTEPVPSLVEHALVPVGPLLFHVMRSMTAAGRVVGEERFASVLGTDPVEPLDRAVGHGVGEVVRIVLVVERLRRPDDLLVLSQAGVPLARAAPEDAVEVVEAPAVRPTVERPCRALLAVRRQMPLAERSRAVPVVPKDPWQRCAVPRKDGGIAREPARELTDRAEPHRVIVPTGEERGTRRGAERRHVEPVVAQPTLGHPCVVRRLDGAPEGAGVAEPGVVDQHEEDVRRPVRRGGVPDQVPVRLRPVERPVRNAGEGGSTDRESGAIGLAHPDSFIARRGSRSSRAGRAFRASATLAPFDLGRAPR